jgi:sulfate adenylyltransferase subunit 1 (EFTu-like GTPase family)
MDLVEFRQDVFGGIRRDFQAFAKQLGIGDAEFIPMSALDGDNVVRPSPRTPWYGGPSLLEHLETVPIASDRNLTDFRFPVQYVVRPNLDFRGFAGQVASGVVRRGDAVTVLPSGRHSRVKEIVTWDGSLDEAFTPMSVTLRLEDELDVSRGDMLAAEGNLPHAGRRFHANLVWMNAKPLQPRHGYLLKHTTQMVQARIREIRHRVNIRTLESELAEGLELNEIGLVEVETHRPLFFDPYSKNRATGAFILIDSLTNETVGAGMIVSPSSEIQGHGRVTAAERRARYGHGVAVLVIENQELAYATERYLFDHGCQVVVLRGGLRDTTLVAELAAGGVILILDWTPAQNELHQVPILRPSGRENAYQICAGLLAEGLPDPPISSCGEGI